MKLFYGIILVMMVFVSACAPQVVQPEADTTPLPTGGQDAGDAIEEKEDAGEVMEDKGDTLEGKEGEAMEDKGDADIRALGAGAFDPDELTISAGSSVTWMNSANKNLVILIFKDGKSYMNSQKIDPGEIFENEFTEAGEYQYWQNIAYSGDGGTITVE